MIGTVRSNDMTLARRAVDLLTRSYFALEGDSAPGIDSVTWQAYGEDLEEKLTRLHDRIHKGSYRARPARWT